MGWAAATVLLCRPTPACPGLSQFPYTHHCELGVYLQRRQGAAGGGQQEEQQEPRGSKRKADEGGAAAE